MSKSTRTLGTVLRQNASSASVTLTLVVRHARCHDRPRSLQAEQQLTASSVTWQRRSPSFVLTGTESIAFGSVGSWSFQVLFAAPCNGLDDGGDCQMKNFLHQSRWSCLAHENLDGCDSGVPRQRLRRLQFQILESSFESLPARSSAHNSRLYRPTRLKISHTNRSELNAIQRTECFNGIFLANDPPPDWFCFRKIRHR